MMTIRRFLAALGMVAVCVGSARAETDAEILRQQDKQKQVQAETDFVVRRVGTMLRVMDFYQIDKADEKKVLEEVVGTLAGLSREQMNDVIKKLGLAARADDPSKTNEQLV